MPASLPAPGEIARVRQRLYLVEQVVPPPRPADSTLIGLSCIDDDAQGQHLEVLWERELDAEVMTGEAWDAITRRGFDPPTIFSAYLNTLRWNCVTATDPKLFQSPFRAGIHLDAYQLEPLQKALLLPRVHRPGQRLDQLCGFSWGKRRAIELGGQVAAAAEFQREERQAVMLADLVYLHAIWMLKPRHRFRLGAKASPVLLAGMAAGQDHFQRNDALEGELPRLVYDPHAAAAQFTHDLIAGNQGPLRFGLIRRRCKVSGAGTRSAVFIHSANQAVQVL